MKAPSQNESVFDLAKPIRIMWGSSMLSTDMLSTEKSREGSPGIAQIYPDLKNLKKHVRNAVQSMVLSCDGDPVATESLFAGELATGVIGSC